MTGISTHGLTGSLQNSVLAGQALAIAPIATGQQASMTMHHYWRIRGGKIEQFRGSEDTQQTARVLTPALTPTGNP